VTELETLRGELSSFEVRTADGWGTGTVKNDDGAHKITGKLVGVRPGEAVELAGSWAETKYGRQFKVRQCVSTVPQTIAGVVTWMASALPEVGDKRARAMVQRFGVSGLWEAIESNPQALCTIDGITPERAEAIALAYEERRADRDAMIALHAWGLSDRQVAKCVEQWDCDPAEVVRTIRANPYVLMEDVTGFGFVRADDVALRAGIAHDSPMRIAAALRHLLGQEVLKGHCFVTQGKLRVMAEKLLGLPEPTVQQVMREQYTRGAMVVRGQRVYLPKLDRDEADAADKIQELLLLQGVAS
jgi:exodeoxyribonuclease V alpha subunit